MCGGVVVVGGWVGCVGGGTYMARDKYSWPYSNSWGVVCAIGAWANACEQWDGSGRVRGGGGLLGWAARETGAWPSLLPARAALLMRSHALRELLGV